MSHEKNRALIDTLYNCAIECSHCATACLTEDDVKMMVDCIRIDLDCADICRLTATLLSRGSQHGLHLLEECAEVCKKCADEGEQHRHLEHCERCAEVCYKCAQECLQMQPA